MIFPDVPETVHQAIVALQKGDKTKAHTLLQQVVREHPDDERFWLWLSWTVETEEEQEQFLNRVLEINPENVAARKWFERSVPLTDSPLPASPIDTPSTPIPSLPLNSSQTADVDDVEVASTTAPGETDSAAAPDTVSPDAPTVAAKQDTTAALDSTTPPDTTAAPGEPPDTTAAPGEPPDTIAALDTTPPDTTAAPGEPPDTTAAPDTTPPHTISPDAPTVAAGQETATIPPAAREQQAIRATREAREVYSFSLSLPELHELKDIKFLSPPFLFLYGTFVIVVVAFLLSVWSLFIAPDNAPENGEGGETPVASPMPIPSPSATIHPPEHEVQVQHMRWRLIAATDEGATLPANADEGRPELQAKGRFIRVVVEVENVGTQQLTFRHIPLRDNEGQTFEVPADYGILSHIANEHQCEHHLLPPHESRVCQMIFDVPRDAQALLLQVDDQVPVTRDHALIRLDLPPPEE